MFRPTTKKLKGKILIILNFFSPCHFKKEKKNSIFFLLGIFTRRKKGFLNLSNKIYFSGSKNPP